MKMLVILTQLIILFYGSQFFELGGHLDNVRFVAYAVIILNGFLVRHKISSRGPRLLDLVAFGVLGAAFFSSTYSMDSQTTLLRALSVLLLYLAVFWALWMSFGSAQEVASLAEALITSWFLFYMANAAFLLLRPGDAFNVHEVEGYRRFHGLTVTPNGLADLSAMALPLILWNFMRRKGVASGFFLAVVLFCWYFPFSRGALISGLIGMSTYFFLGNPRQGALSVFSTVFLISAMCFYITIFGISLPLGLIRPESLGMLGGRLEAWRVALEPIRLRPWLGYGFGTEPLIFPYFGYRFELHAGDYAHNSFLGLTLQLGWIVAFGLYLAMVVFFIRGFFHIQRHTIYRRFTAAIYASTLAGFFTTFTESWLYSAGCMLAFPFYMCLMLLIRMMEFQKKEERLKPIRFFRFKGLELLFKWRAKTEEPY